MATASIIHTFEERGLGKAPFTFLREIDLGLGNKSSCDHCGAAIRYEEIIRDTNGKTFKVGCVCVEKTGDRGLIDTMKREKRRQREEAKYQARVTEIAAAQAAERKRNGGLLDWEVEAQKRDDERRAMLSKFQAINAWFVKELFDRFDGDFAESMKAQLLRKPACDLSPRQQSALRDMIARGYGRRGSKAYDAFCIEFDKQIDILASEAV